MEYVIKLGEDTTYEDYQQMIENHELDDVLSICENTVKEFVQRYPSAVIDNVQIVINKPDTDLQKVDTIIMGDGHKVLL